MTARETWARYPWAVKVPYLLFLAAMLPFAVGVIMQSDKRWLFVPFPLAATLLGIVLLLNLSGAATAASDHMRERRPMRVDFSQSFLATPGYFRFFGGFLAAIGVGMAIAALTQPLSEL